VVCTMSAAEQPLLRSLAGFARPCMSGPRARAPPRRSVGDVAGVEIGKDKDIGVTSHRRTGRLLRADPRNERCVELKLAVKDKGLSATFELGPGVAHLGHQRMVGRTHGGEGQKPDSGFSSHDGPEGVGGRYRNLC